MSDAPQTLLRLEDVGLTYERPVLRGVSLEVARGQTVVVIGESGCGKTQLLKMCIGLVRPTAGRVLFDGRDIAALTGRELTAQRARMGFLFQGAALFDSMNVFENVAFGLRARGNVPESAVRETVARRLAEVGLPPDVGTKTPAEISGGQKKRVGLARALALEPELMLWDEPTTGLDPIMTDVINELIDATRVAGSLTNVVVTHEMRTVEKVADRVVMLYPLARLGAGEPQVLYDGPPEGLAEHPDRRVRQFVKGEAGDRLRESQG